MRILADVNVPEEYVSALRGDGHEVVYSRAVEALGATATDEAITAYAEAQEFAILSTDVTVFADRNTDVPVLVAPQDTTGRQVQAAVSRIVALPFDPAAANPLWLSSL